MGHWLNNDDNDNGEDVIEATCIGAKRMRDNEE